LSDCTDYNITIDEQNGYYVTIYCETIDNRYKDEDGNYFLDEDGNPYIGA